MTSQVREQLQKTLGTAYTLERELGGGGMSKVFLAEDTRLKRKVVVKVLAPELAQGISVERFEREIQTAAALQQANIVPVLSAGETNGLPFYMMPYVTGESLRARLARGPLAINEVVNILRDVARALAFAHRQGVVHRDIKPDNVLLSEGAAVVTDFGIAKAISAARTGGAGATLTQVGTSIGTPAYMAPEQAAGDPAIDHRADIYSLGALAYELLTLQLVFANRTPQRMLAAHMGEVPRPVAELRPDTPQQLAELVMRCLAKDANDRPRDAAEVLSSLETTGGGSMQAMPSILMGGPGMFRRALAIYAAAFVIVAIVAKAAIAGIGLPDWVFPGALVVMALGLPVVLWTGYVQRVARRAALASPTFTPGGSAASPTHGTIANMALKAAPRMSWYRTARGGFYAFGTFIALIVAFMAMRQLGIGPFGSLTASGKLKARAPILITDFRMTSADTSLGRVVGDAVRAGLSESNVITLLAPDRVGAALTRAGRMADTRMDLALARTIAPREGISLIVDGDVTGIGAGFIAQLRLVTADSGLVLASFRETGDGPRGLIDAVDKLTRSLRAKAGESLRKVQSTPPLAEVTTPSLEALRKYTEGYRLEVAGRFPEAIELARQAIALDTGFALAYRLLSEAIVNAVGPGLASDSAIQKAYDFRARLGERERLAVIGDYFANGPGRDRAKAIAAFRRQVEMGELSNTNSLGILLVSQREYAAAESLAIRRLAAEPTALLSANNLVSWRLEHGDVVGADSLSRAPGVGTRVVRIRLAMIRDSLPAAASIADSGVKEARIVRGINDFRSFCADIAAMQGRFAARNAVLREGEATAVASAPAQQSPASVAAGINIARNNGLAFGPSKDDVRSIDALVASPAFQGIARTLISPTRFTPFVVINPMLEAASAYGAAGDAAKARQMLTRFDAEVRDTAALRSLGWNRNNALGFVLLAEGKAAEAIVELRKGDLMYDGKPTPCSACLPIGLAMAYGAMGERDSTIANIERFIEVTKGHANPQGFATVVGPMHERLGQLYEAKGDAVKAAEYYRKFTEMWKGADAELQPRVRAARERLAKLNPIEPKR